VRYPCRSPEHRRSRVPFVVPSCLLSVIAILVRTALQAMVDIRYVYDGAGAGWLAQQDLRDGAVRRSGLGPDLLQRSATSTSSYVHEPSPIASACFI
jgi:hypothetical protein